MLLTHAHEGGEDDPAASSGRWHGAARAAKIDHVVADRTGATLEMLEAGVRRDYAGPGRAYHGLAHLDGCLAKLDEVQRLDAHGHRILRLALLWHDVVYDPRRNDNEERSAERAERELNATGLPRPDVLEVSRLILLTKRHRVRDGDRLGALIVSIDLFTLVTDARTYDAYARAIRAEYAHVPDELYRTGRRGVLEALLETRPLFADQAFGNRYEAQAERNMRREIEALGG